MWLFYLLTTNVQENDKKICCCLHYRSKTKENFYNIESKVHLTAIFIAMKRETVQFDDMCS